MIEIKADLPSKLVLPWHSSLLHDVSSGDVITPHIILPLLQTNHSAQHIPSVDTYPHVHLHPGQLSDGADGGDHRETHLDNVDGVVGS